MGQEPSLADWQRILMGDAPWVFLVELLLRSMVVYLLLLLFMRLMGKRVAAQMSCAELAVILMLGAAIGLPLQVPDKGLLPAVCILLVVLLFHRGLMKWTFRSRAAELMTYGDAIILLKDGRLLPEGLKQALLSPHKIFASLRGKGVGQLGELKRVYVEASGDLSLIRYRTPIPGLLIIPGFESTGRYETLQGAFACSNCGSVVSSPLTPTGRCGDCGVVCSRHPAVTGRKKG